MSEERTQYTTQPDELTRLRAESIRLRNELDKQLKAWGGYVDAHAGNYSRMNARIAELEAKVRDTEDDLAATITAQTRRIKELEATVARLRNERLIEYNVPVTLLRYIVNSHPTLPVDDRITASRWLDTVKVTHD